MILGFFFTLILISISSTVTHGSQGAKSAPAAASALRAMSAGAAVDVAAHELTPHDERTKKQLELINFMRQTFTAPLIPLISAYAAKGWIHTTVVPADQRFRFRPGAYVGSLSNGRFALCRGARVQTYHLSDNGSAKAEKENFEYALSNDDDERENDTTTTITSLHDDTFFVTRRLRTYAGFAPVYRHGVFHCTPAQNTTRRAVWPSYSLKILPLLCGQVVLFDESSAHIAAHARALRDAQVAPTLPKAEHALLVSHNNVVLTHDRTVGVYQIPQWQRTASTNLDLHENVHGIERLDNKHFMIWGARISLANPFPSNSDFSFVDRWRIHPDRLERVGRLVSKTGIRFATVRDDRCFGVNLFGTAQVCDLIEGEAEWEQLPITGVTSCASLSDGTILVGHHTTAVSRVDLANHLEEALMSFNQQKECRGNHKKVMAEINAKAPQIMDKILLKKKIADASQAS
jgi:hypothetical protein